jgi:hypothetical protein
VLIGREVIVAICLYKQPRDLRNPTLAAAAKITVWPIRPAFLLQTGCITYLAEPEDSDTVDQILIPSAARKISLVPGEHGLKTLPLHQAESPLDGES